MIKKIIKLFFPEKIKKILRSIENTLLRATLGFKKPIILDDKFGSKFILYPEENWPIRWKIEKSAYTHEFAAMDEIVKKNYIVFDVGANTGSISSYLSNKVGDNGKIIAFEPFPKTFLRLKNNIALNNFKNITLEEIALSDSEGKKEFYFNKKNPELNSLGIVEFENELPFETTEVKVSTLDNYCSKNNIQVIDFLKIDVEGFEVEVLTGAAELLNNKKIKSIQFEISPIPLRCANKSPDDLVNLFNKIDYEIFDFNILTKEFVRIHKLTDKYSNYYAFPKR